MPVMVGPTFEEIWTPRIGAQATAQLRRSSALGLVTIPILFGLAIACSFLLTSGRSSEFALGVLAAILAVGIFGAWIRSRIKLAAAVSEWFGVDLGWQEMPRMRSADKFDAWCHERGLIRADR